MIPESATSDKVYLAGYARWLCEQHLVTELARHTSEQLASLGVEFLYFLAEKTGKSSELYIKIAVEQLLFTLQKGTTVSWLNRKVISWVNHQYSYTGLYNLSHSEALQCLQAFKNALLAFLPQFTTKPTEIIALVNNLDSLYLRLLDLFSQEAKTTFAHQFTERNHFLQAILKNMQAGLIVLDRNWRYLEWNPVAEEIFGRKREEVIGKKIDEVFTSELMGNFTQEAQPALEGVTLVSHQVPYRSRKGYYSRIIAPLWHSPTDEDPIGVLLLLYDTTTYQAQEEALTENLGKLHKAQGKLKRTIRQLEEAQALAQIGHWEFSLTKNKVSWSKELWRIFGLSPNHANIGPSTYLQYVHQQDRQVVHRLLKECIEKDQPYVVEHRICRPDGTECWLLSQGKLVRNKAGKPIKVRGTALDITYQKRAEIKAQEEQYFIRSVAATSPDIILVFDINRKEIVYNNRSLYETFGYKGKQLQELAELTGPQQLEKIIYDADLVKVYKFLEKFRHTRKANKREVEYRVNTPKGQYLWMLGRFTPFKREQSGEVSQIIGILQDVTVQKKNAEALKISENRLRKINLMLEAEVNKRTRELQQKNKELVRKNTDLDNFVYTASHDLKVPIANLEGLLTLLNTKLEKGLNAREQELLGMVHTSIARLKETIIDLTDVARLQKQLEEEEFEEVDFNEVLSDVLADMQQLIDENSAKIFITSPIKKIQYNKKNLRSILSNLITNSIKYKHAERSPSVYITLQKENKELNLLQIRDNGAGIPERHLPKIFNLFKRLSRQVEGSGMGLYIVKRIVENSGGYIEVESQPEKGTTFNLYLANHNNNVR